MLICFVPRGLWHGAYGAMTEDMCVGAPVFAKRTAVTRRTAGNCAVSALVRERADERWSLAV